ncbi:MAG: hypothetical protein KAJ64_02165 [Thermoplasmata archaeon]|nr:hypothetical protein [Thermoplasmata archaeon]
MKTYIKMQFSSEGMDPSKIIKILEDLGWKTVVGEYDFMYESSLSEGLGDSFKNMIDELNNELKGTGVRYSLYSFP